MKRRRLILILAALCHPWVHAGAATAESPARKAEDVPVVLCHSFAIEQRERPDDDSDPGGARKWQTWICPRNPKLPAYQLELWHGGEIDWAAGFTISPNEKFLLHIQKIGSGDNYGATYARGRDGHFHAQQAPTPGLSLSEQAFEYFRKKTGLAGNFYHNGIGFESWGTDGQCVEISLHGTDCDEAYYVSRWRLHYNLVTGKFFQTLDQLAANRRAIVVRHRRKAGAHGRSG